MTRIIILFFTTLIIMSGEQLTAQVQPFQSIPLGVALPSEMDSVPLNARQLLVNRLQQAATKSGAMSAVGPRFVLAATTSTLDRNIIGGTSPMIVHSMELNLYVVDFFEKKIFTSTSISLKGVGNNDQKAYTAAFRQVRSSDKRILDFLKESRQKIGTYYERFCDRVLKRADNLVTQRQFEEAFHTLAIVPEECSACYEKANQMISDFYEGYVEHVCVKNLAKAQSLWVSGQNALNATEAGKFLSKILPDAACYNDAQELMARMEAKCIEENWEFEMAKYYNDVQLEWQKHTDAVSLERQRIEAARQVGIEKARNRPVVYYRWSLFSWTWFVW